MTWRALAQLVWRVRTELPQYRYLHWCVQKDIFPEVTRILVSEARACLGGSNGEHPPEFFWSDNINSKTVIL